MTLFKFLIVASLCYLTYSLELPSYIAKCKANDPDAKNCVISSGNIAIPKIAEGVPAFGIPPLDPLKGLTANIESKNLKLQLSEMDVYGLSNSKITDFSMDYPKGEFNFKIDIKEIMLKGIYEISGRILVLPISGKGPMTLHVENPKFDVKIKCSFVEKKGAKYMDCKTEKADFVVKKGHVELSNLFGSPEVSKETNKVLNQNFEEVIKELGPAISETICSVADLIIQRFFDKASVDEIFTS